MLLPHKLAEHNINSILSEIAEATGLLTSEDHNYWTFSHIFFQGFFCVNYLIDKSSSVSSDYGRFKDDYNWINVWNNLIAMSSDPEFYTADKSDNEYAKSLSLVRMTTLLRKSDYMDSIIYSDVLNQFGNLIGSYSQMIESISYAENRINIMLKNPSDKNLTILWYILCILLIKNHEHTSESEDGFIKGETKFVKLINQLFLSKENYLLNKTENSIEILIDIP